MNSAGENWIQIIGFSNTSLEMDDKSTIRRLKQALYCIKINQIRIHIEMQSIHVKYVSSDIVFVPSCKPAKHSWVSVTSKLKQADHNFKLL